MSAAGWKLLQRSAGIRSHRADQAGDARDTDSRIDAARARFAQINGTLHVNSNGHGQPTFTVVFAFWRMEFDDIEAVETWLGHGGPLPGLTQ